MHSLTTFTEWEMWSNNISKSVTTGAIPFPMIYLGSEYSLDQNIILVPGFIYRDHYHGFMVPWLRHDSRHQYFNWPFDWRHKSFWIPGEHIALRSQVGERSVFDKVREGELWRWEAQGEEFHKHIVIQIIFRKTDTWKSSIWKLIFFKLPGLCITWKVFMEPYYLVWKLQI